MPPYGAPDPYMGLQISFELFFGAEHLCLIWWVTTVITLMFSTKHCFQRCQVVIQPICWVLFIHASVLFLAWPWCCKVLAAQTAQDQGLWHPKRGRLVVRARRKERVTLKRSIVSVRFYEYTLLDIYIRSSGYHNISCNYHCIWLLHIAVVDFFGTVTSHIVLESLELMLASWSVICHIISGVANLDIFWWPNLKRFTFYRLED